MPVARERKYHRLLHKQAALMQISPLARFSTRFHRAVQWSWREMLTQHMFEDGVMTNEYMQELQWARSRKLSMHHAFAPSESQSQEDEDATNKALSEVIAHYGLERVSAAKAGKRSDRLWAVFFESLIKSCGLKVQVAKTRCCETGSESRCAAAVADMMTSRK